ncbi:MAG: hypothetical protein Q8J89_09995 [Caulobacter sp.]|nr:hypothetical protein [Caulobacter sp.]
MSKAGMTALGAALGLLTAAGTAQARDDHPCSGPSPVAGVEIRGPVLHVVDGATLCVALGFEPDSWILLRLADAPPPSSIQRVSTAQGATPNPRGALMQAALAKMATCRTVRGEDGGIEAVCEVEGRLLGETLRDPEIVAISYSWR